MRGHGSGRWYSRGSKTITENLHRIDIRWLKKQGQLSPGNVCGLSWSWGNKKTGSIGFMMESDCMKLKYRCRPNSEEWEPLEQTIFLDRTPCHFGGHRKWFLCTQCRKRVVVIYEAEGKFLCRHCCDLTYASQRENKLDRFMRKARKIRARLGASNNLMAPLLSKPKNMHQKTFDRLRAEENHVNNHLWMIIGSQLDEMEGVKDFV